MATSTTIITIQPATTVNFPPGDPSTFSVLTQTSRDGTVLPIVIDGFLGAKSTLTLLQGVGFPAQPSTASPVNPEPGTPAPSTTTSASTAVANPTTAQAQATSVLTTSPSSTASQSNRRSTISSVAPPQASSRPSNASSAEGPRAGSDFISPGAAAGIGIGSAIAGALLAALILFLLFRRRLNRNRTPRSDVIPLNGYNSSLEKPIAASRDPTTSSLAPPAAAAVTMIEKHLPQPAEDQALGGEMSRLRTSIKNHVQSYYHTDAVRRGGVVDQAALALVAAGNMPLIASTLGSLLANPATRVVAIRFCIAWVAISRIEQHNCEPGRSFLPPEVAGCLMSIAGGGGAREKDSLSE
ncbi:MAG: hypothetical protein LQ341_007739 [Variospora aurantia]|nr:MAG: hypothetical protein LQ341_007739 [Variospora aurantia]